MKYRFSILVIVLSVIVITGCKKKMDNEALSTPVIDVSQPIVDSVVLYKTYPGYLYADSEVEVVGEVSGRLLGKHYESGQYVNKGQVLYTIDPTTYQQAVERARASLSTAQAQYDYAVKQHSAMQRALKADAVSKMEVVQAESNVRQYAAEIKSAQASLASAQTSLNKCTVRAPISGYVASSEIDVGGYVNGEGAPIKLTTIYDNNRIHVNFSIEDSQYELMVGKGGVNDAIYRSVPIDFTTKLPHQYTTDLYYEAPDVDQSTGTVVLKGEISNDYKELKSGMYCTVRLPYGDNPKAVLIKDKSIGTDQLGKYIYLVNDSDKVVYTHIEVGEIYQDSLRLVTKGVKPGDKYVTSALLKVRQGMKIKPRLMK
ncbi:MAG: efflux RND transporter periplasmic adaptor subunit [Prevotella sp.]|nr:efflux RND transporter periplasmic adaptor subunit [Bacteroides sp.]MCM1365879.1 efflux RND transporter periplasmic adaptor subunit [Prevotella sp.]